MATRHCDVAIIGAGTAGIAAERSARATGATTVLIDDRFAGTTCATVGCMPSKLLIAAAQAAHTVRQAPLFGVRTGRPIIDGEAVLRRVRLERDAFAHSTKQAFKELPEGVCIRARARFTGASTLALDDGQEVEARAIVIATGSKSVIPKAFQSVSAALLTNETLFELPRLPRSVAVIGAGPLGLELAQALHRLGVEIRVFSESDGLSGIADEAVAGQYRSILEQELSFSLGVQLEASPRAAGVTICWEGTVSGEQDFERVLIAAGRPPQLAGLDLEKTGLELDTHGTPKFDPRTMQCGTTAIFMAGDADHDRPVLHEAAAEGVIAGRNAAGVPQIKPTQRYVPLAITFTDPQLAIIGAIATPDDPRSVLGCASYDNQGRAKVFARNAGLVHLYADALDGRLTGASLCGPAVEHSAHLVAWAIQKRMTASDVLMLPFYHPTYEEGLKAALRSICKAVRAPLHDLLSPGE